MAKSSITLDIGTSYKGEGFKKLNQALSNATGNTRRTTSEWAKFHQSAAKMASTAWTEFYSKIRVVTGAVKSAWDGLKMVLSKSFAFETQTRQFKTLIGSIDEAKAHMQDLKELGDTPPFSLDEFARDSRQMMVMTDGALGLKASMKLVGDAAAATGNDIETIGHAVGRLYAFIRDGEPISRAAMELRNMGILTPELVQNLKEMQEAGASSVDIWEKVEEALGRYQGAMEEVENTGDGLIAAISSRWDNFVRQFGDAFKDTAEGGMRDVLDAMKDLEEDGSIQVWAENALKWINALIDGAKLLAPLGKTIAMAWKNLNLTVQAPLRAIGAYIGAIRGGGSPIDAVKAAFSEVKQSAVDVYDLDDAQKQEDERRKQEIAQKKQEQEEKKRQEAAARQESEKQRKLKALKDADEKRNQQKVDETMSDATSEVDKMFDDFDKQAKQVAKDEEDRRRKRKADAERQRIKDHNAGINTQIAKEKEAGAAQQRSLDERLDAARQQIENWSSNFEKNKKLRYTDFNKQMIQFDRDNAVQLGVDANGNPIAVDKNQANEIRRNRERLEGLLKIKKPNEGALKEIARRKAFDDMFNPEKLKERQKAAEKLEKEKLEAEKKMQTNIAALKKMLVDNNGVAI